MKDFSTNPWYDDFDENKKFLKILFKPGYAVQARELTQIQTLLQNQINRFGNNIFKNNSLVSGGETFLQKATFIKLKTTYDGIDIVSNNFTGTIYNSANTKRAEILVAYDKVLNTETSSYDAPVIMVKQLYGDSFSEDEVIYNSSYTPIGNVSNTQLVTTVTGTGLVFSVNEGIFYHDGYFVKNEAQTIAISKESYNDANASARIGFNIVEDVVTYQSDSTLLDPAQGASNFQAPGGDRFTIDLVLATRTLDDTVDESTFIELMRVENGTILYQNKFPAYAVLADTLARRTYDESGNYTVRPFQITLTTNEDVEANADVTLSPGKAYVYGYEIETVGPTTITVDKPREYESFENKAISADYGNYLFTTNHHGAFDVSSYETLNLHCVAASTIALSTDAELSNTKIGTAKIKSIGYINSSNISDSSTYTYQTFVTDLSVGVVTGNVDSGTTNTHVVLATNYSVTTDDAYKGAKLSVIDVSGNIYGPKKIKSYSKSTKTVEVDSAFSVVPDNTYTFEIDFDVGQIRSLIVGTNHSTMKYSDVSTLSFDSENQTFLSESSKDPMILNLGEEYIRQSSISDFTYYTKRIIKNQTASSGTLSVSLAIGESLASGTSLVDKFLNYYISVVSSGGSPYSAGQIIPADKILSTTTNSIVVENGASMVADIICTVYVSNPAAKLKTYIPGNTTIQTSGETSLYSGNVNVYVTEGQTRISSDYTVKEPNIPQNLYVTDVTDLVKVIDIGSGGIDITNRYVLDNGQRDGIYDYASIKLKPRNPSPVGPIVVVYNRFQASGSDGYYFCVDSYSGVDYGDIPSYTSTSGEVYNLRDCLDFRPRKQDAVETNLMDTVSCPKTPAIGSDVNLNFDHYLPRNDKVALDKDGNFRNIRGVASKNPQTPSDIDTAMTLYVLEYPPYTVNTSDVKITYIDNRRYTMRDIGAIEKRVTDLEYYTSLSLLEQQTLALQDLTILDSQNLPRFKNGILVDAFTGFDVGDVENEDFTAAIDVTKNELRPAGNLTSSVLVFDANNSTNVKSTGSLVTLDYSNVQLINQNIATRTINVNPFNVISFKGKVTLLPQTDIWVDITRLPDLVVPDLTGSLSNWTKLIPSRAYSVSWGAWNHHWSGLPAGQAQMVKTRTGISSVVTLQKIEKHLGDRIVDVSVVPYMRNIPVKFAGFSFKPNTVLYSFFDNRDVSNYVERANKVTANSNTITFGTISDGTMVSLFNVVTEDVATTGKVLAVSNNVVYIDTLYSNSPVGTSFEMDISGNASNIGIKYDHYSGNVTSYDSITKKITLASDAKYANNSATYTNSVFYVTTGTGSGQKGTIQTYDSTNNAITLTTNLTVSLDSTSRYSIGPVTSDLNGIIAGRFNIPNGMFKTGEKRLTFIDSSVNDTTASYSEGSATFISQGTTKTVQDTVVSVVAPTVTTQVVTESVYYDPLAQTFAVDPKNYPRGIFVSRIAVCFQEKDPVVPITLQIRPTVNGYPSSTTTYPYATVTLTPDKINTVPLNTTTNTYQPTLDMYGTHFVFESPVYLLPGEHAIVLMSDSNKYVTYAAEIGKMDLRNNKLVSEQPYGGTLFKSQNASTWTPDQNMDLMFRIYRCEFETTGTAQFKVDSDVQSRVYDVLSLISSEVCVSGTEVKYNFQSQRDYDDSFVGSIPIVPTKDYEMVDGFGRRKIENATTGTFLLNVAFTTSYTDVSPMVDATHMGILTIENIINNLELDITDVYIADPGADYYSANNLIITGDCLTAASGNVSVTGGGPGPIDEINFFSVGSGYAASPTITIDRAGTAVINYIGETDKKGGNAVARYVTKPVVLADGFDSGDLRVYLTAYKPSVGSINVYYKILSSTDSDTIDNKSWNLMTQVGNSAFSSISRDDYRELTFAPGTKGTPDNTVNTKFKSFALKIVLASSDSTNVPKVKNFRAIAIPAG